MTGAASGSAASTGQPEHLVLTDVRGTLDIAIDPYLVVGVPSTTYTLQATVVPKGTVGGDLTDTDGDGVVDDADACPDVAGVGSTGCPVPSDEKVTVHVDGTPVASEDVESSHGADAFAIDVTVPTGTHEVRTVWTRDGEVLATDVRTVVHAAAGVDRDGDGVADTGDNCVRQSTPTGPTRTATGWGTPATPTSTETGTPTRRSGHRARIPTTPPPTPGAGKAVSSRRSQPRVLTEAGAP
ncbi:thrombospondin type 3 repeat-containing protein [Nocardioides sp. B-3]|nr:thrombospondin type 3 repeat-containing protein [Nocardioides sp. B-3]UUZ58674.1 thrombospondin type 3 repeat-containing protein [Nocardioides sp. B-3]